MLNTSYWYAGSFDDWFLNCDADFTTDDIAEWFLKSLSANGADSDADVDGTVNPQYGRPVKITVRVYVSDCTGTVYITDMLFQDGALASGWVGHVSEIQWTQDGD